LDAQGNGPVKLILSLATLACSLAIAFTSGAGASSIWF
jgi:hypothetical protein